MDGEVKPSAHQPSRHGGRFSFPLHLIYCSKHPRTGGGVCFFQISDIPPSLTISTPLQPSSSLYSLHIYIINILIKEDPGGGQCVGPHTQTPSADFEYS